WTFGTARNDQWRLVPTDSGYYQLINRKSGQALNVNGASLSDGATILQWPAGATKQNDQWMPVSVGGGYYNLVNRHSGLLLDVFGGFTTNGTTFEQWHSTG